MPSFEVRTLEERATGQEQQLSLPAPISRALSYLILAAGICTVAASAWIVIRSYSPVLHWDQWNVVDRLIRGHGHLTFSLLWEQNNEHRHPLGMLLGVADLFWFGGRNKSLLMEIFLVQAIHFAVLAGVARRFGGFTGTALVTAAGLLAFCLFSPLQVQNFTWGFQVPFVLAGCAASLCFAGALWYASIPGARSRLRNLALAACIAAAFLSEINLANGLLAWPVLVLLAFTLGFSHRDLIIIAVVGTSAIALYFIGYHSPGIHANPVASLQQPLTVLKFALTCLAFSWDGHLPNPSDWPVLAEWIALLAAGVAVAGSVQCIRKRRACSRFEAFLFAEMMFALGGIILTALGRINFGYEQAIASRYQSVALIFWGCLGLLIVGRLTRVRLNTGSFTAVQAGILLLLLASGSRFVQAADWAMEHKLGLAHGYDELRGYDKGQSMTRVVYPDAAAVRVYYEYMKQHGWGPKPSSLMAYPSVEPSAAPATIGGYESAPASECSGFIDGAVFAEKFGSFGVGGWAWDRRDHSLPSAVGLAASNGHIIGFAKLGGSRPDVSSSLAEIKASDSGWNGEFDLKDGQTYRAFAVLKDGRSACTLGNQLTVARRFSGK